MPPTTEIAAHPLTDHCVEPLQRAEHACLGISPFNSHFSTDHIATLTAWALQQFRSVHLFVPDQAAAYTLEALGYAPQRAAVKARRQGRYLHNKIQRSLQAIEVPAGDDLVLDAATVESNEHYRALHDRAHTLFQDDPQFHHACLQASRWVLDNRAGQAPTQEQLRLAVRYFLAELPLFLDTPSIVGTDSSVFCYHHAPAFLHALYRRELPCIVHPRQGFATLTLQPAAAAAH